MLKSLTWQFKLLLAAVVFLPLIGVTGTYMVRSESGPQLVVAASNADTLHCVSTSSPVDVNQCVTWSGTVGASMIELGLLAVEILVVIIVAVALRRSQRRLVMPKVLLLAAAIIAGAYLAVAGNMLMQPHSQQGLASASKQNGVYVVDKQPALGVGPTDVGIFMLASLIPAAGIVLGTVSVSVADQRGFAGMTKEKLFQ